MIIDLNGVWKLRESKGRKNPETNDIPDGFEVTVPGTLYSDLMKGSTAVSPFFGESDQNVIDWSARDYVYERYFQIPEVSRGTDSWFLVCEGIDTLATIHLNGSEAGTCENMHRTYRFDITSLVRKGENHVAVTIRSPLEFVRRMNERKPVWGMTRTTIPGYQYIRKAHCQFGWDFGPQLPDLGIFRNIYIEQVRLGRIDAVSVSQDNSLLFVEKIRRSERISRLSIQVDNVFTPDGTEREDLQIRLRITDPDGEIAAKARETARCHQVLTVDIPQPRLWWPNGYGEQALYHVKLQLVCGKEVLDTREFATGLRNFGVIRRKDRFGESFVFQINGCRMFAKGANYVPEDAVFGCRTKERTRKLLTDCARSHFNCIRVWGGGCYPDSWFYDLCDELGLIVWQDFMFACGVYDLDDAFRENIRQECIDNVRRLRTHPSLGLWCGNNEMETAWEDWEIPQDQKLRQDYIEMFERLIPEVLRKEDPDRFYWPSSPSSGGGFVNPSCEEAGDAHYWEVWHGNLSLFEEIETRYFRFFSEFGFEAMPDLRTLQTVVEPDQMNLTSCQMESHQKCENGNAILMYYLARYYRLPSDFEQMIYATQCLQCDYLEMAIRHLRSHTDRCSGSLYWHINDCWPSVSGSTIDYYGRWKGAQYAVRRSFEPLIAYAEPDESGGHYLVYVSNDSPEAAEADVIAWVIDQDQGMLVQKTGTIRLKAFSSGLALRVRLPESLIEEDGQRPATALPPKARRNSYFCYSIQNTAATMGGGIRLFCAPKYFHFLDPELEGTVVGGKNGYKIRISACHYARRVQVSFDGIDVILSDNFFDIEPSISRWIAVEEIRDHREISSEFLQKRLRIRSNYDL